MTATFCSALRSVSRCLTPIFFGTFFVLTVSSQTFIGTGTGNIPNGGIPWTCGAPLNVEFEVTAVSVPLADIMISFTGDHPHIGDLDVRLTAPDSTSHSIISLVGKPSSFSYGDSSNLNGAYSFSDLGILNMWHESAIIGDGQDLPNGIYRTQAAGPFSPVDPGPGFTSLQTAFASVSDPVGTWTLSFRDCAFFRGTGSISAATLSFGGLAPTAAGVTVAGKITTGSGRAVSGTRVQLTGGEYAQPIYALTNGFGYFSFTDVPAGQTYILSVSSKQYTFANPSRVINLDDEIFDVDFIAEPMFFSSKPRR